MKIDDKVFIRGYVDEIRKDTVIIRNEGGYFGTVPSEIIRDVEPAEAKTQLSDKDASFDTVYRQDAIDALGEEPEVWVKEDDYARGLNNQWRYDVTALKALPSAQPVITCDGCRFVGTYDTDFPCCSCVRREKDYYEPEI